MMMGVGDGDRWDGDGDGGGRLIWTLSDVVPQTKGRLFYDGGADGPRKEG